MYIHKSRLISTLIPHERTYKFLLQQIWPTLTHCAIENMHKGQCKKIHSLLCLHFICYNCIKVINI